MNHESPSPADGSPASRYLEFLRDYLRGKADDLETWCAERKLPATPIRPLHDEWQPLLDALVPARALSSAAAHQLFDEALDLAPYEWRVSFVS